MGERRCSTREKMGQTGECKSMNSLKRYAVIDIAAVDLD